MNEGELSYLADKISAAVFCSEPFKHLYIEDFLSDEHLDLLTTDRQIKRPRADSTAGLIDDLCGAGWRVHSFPGCTDSVEDYLARHAKNEWPADTQRVERGRGLVLRLDPETPRITALVNYLNAPAFHRALEQKFGVDRPNRIETAIQKYLTGYEISPHPDIRSKCLTYLVNINTTPESEALDIHTHLLNFKAEKRFIVDFWTKNPQLGRDHVPWGWCQTAKRITKNNSLVMFEPSNDTLHAAKLRYDHLAFQRTQIYGNLWYTDVGDLPLYPYHRFEEER